jgi:hypothetical protein
MLNIPGLRITRIPKPLASRSWVETVRLDCSTYEPGVTKCGGHIAEAVVPSPSHLEDRPQSNPKWGPLRVWEISQAAVTQDLREANLHLMETSMRGIRSRLCKSPWSSRCLGCGLREWLGGAR